MSRAKEEWNPQEGYTKGGQLHGPPKRWTGRGPAPARHIPWPEIFKHHLSVVEGHMKMLDMVRKHTVEGSGNWRTICLMVERAREMLQMSKQATRSFVPPANTLENIPIGSSSLSMYPGYSPADHQYGEAAQEFGQEWAEAKRKGFDFQPAEDGPQYQIGQSKKRVKKSLEETKADLAAREALRNDMANAHGPVNGAVSGGRYNFQNGPVESPQLPQSETGEAAWRARAAMGRSSQPLSQKYEAQQKANEKRPRAKRASPDASARSPESSSKVQPAFFIDSNPTPVNVPNVPTPPQLKRAASDEGGDPTTTDEATAPKTKKSKKAKASQEFTGPAPLTGDADAVESSAIAQSTDALIDSGEMLPRIELADIEAEVDARVTAKEERRKRKHEKKRKRESGPENVSPPSADAADMGHNGNLEESAQAPEKKPKKKKSKKHVTSHEKNVTVEDVSASATPEDGPITVSLENEVENGRKRKAVSEGDGQEAAEDGKKKKKSKKGKDKSLD